MRTRLWAKAQECAMNEFHLLGLNQVGQTFVRRLLMRAFTLSFRSIWRTYQEFTISDHLLPSFIISHHLSPSMVRNHSARHLNTKTRMPQVELLIEVN